ncbi:hypothetical protein, partial [Rhodococcus wratislaviensis]|uniref:hypothetical protein n=1 Tax=Rhodococcus wratislaviensis TaxID=44752 RepID=UPI001CED2EAB
THADTQGSPADYRLSAYAERFGSRSPAPSDASVLDTLIAAIEVRLGVVPDAVYAIPGVGAAHDPASA